MVKNLSASAGDVRDGGSISEWERSPGERNGNPLQYSCLENSMDGGAWRATVHGIAKSQTQLSNFTTQMVKKLPVMWEDPGTIPMSGRSPGERNGNPLQYSCLENSMDRGDWWVTVHGVAKSQT